MAKKAKKTNTSKKLMKALERQVSKSSLNQVAKDLGYGSHNTVKRWIIIQSIPTQMQESVKNYLGVK